MPAKKFFALFFLCLTFGLTHPAFADDKAEASVFANSLGHKALEIISGDAPKSEKQAKLEELFARNVDIDGIGKFVLGRNWRTATDDQKKRYLANYRTFTIKHYTANISDFTNTDFEVTRVTPDDRGGNIVAMHIKRPGQEDIVTEFDVRPMPNDGLKVYDITVEGVSMITTQRDEFNSVVARDGLDHLIDQLKLRSETDSGVVSKGGE